jgi:tetratricopeptide (TPR) repeat protein
MKSRVATLLTILFVAFATPAQSSQKETQTLIPGGTVQRDLNGAETVAYRIQLKAGQFLHITIEQSGIDVVVSLFAPDGSKLTEMNNRHIANGVEPLSFAASTDGFYRVQLTGSNGSGPGKYALHTDELRPVTANDRERIDAERAAAEGQRLRMLNNRESYRPSLEHYQIALQKWRDLGDRYWQATTLTNIGLVYSQLNENDQAVNAYNEALPLAREVKDPGCEWRILNNLGGLFVPQRDKQKAVNYYKQA